MYPGGNTPFFGAFIRNIENALIDNNVNVDKVVIIGRGNTTREKIEKYLSFFHELRRINLNEYDIVHLSYPSHTYIPLLFNKYYWNRKFKFFVRLHGHDLVSPDLKERLLFRFFRKITLFSVKYADLTIVPSLYFANVLDEKFGKEVKKYIYPSGGVDSNVFYLDKPKFKIKDKVVYGFVGRVEKEKGIFDILKAIEKIDGLILKIVGTGKDFNSVKNYINKKNLKDKVFLLGAMSGSELADMYRSFNYFIFSTHYNESFGNVAIEAMACGCPVIGTKMGALPEYIYNGYNGYLYSSESIDELRAIIEECNSHSKEKYMLLVNNAIEISKEYDRKVLTHKFVDFIKS